MDLKTIEIEGTAYAAVSDGKPVYVSDGKEIAFDVVATTSKIASLNGEAKSHRERAQAAENALKSFDGIKDPAEAIKAMETVKNYTEKNLVEAGEVEKVKSEAIKAVESQYKPVVEELDAMKKALRKEMIGGQFARSKFIQESLAIPSDMVESTFGNLFSIEDGKTVAKDQSGNVIYSKARPGEPADFDEAIASIVEAYPHKDRILRGVNQNGTGSQPGAGMPGAKSMTTSEFDQLSPKAQAEKMSEKGFSLSD